MVTSTASLLRAQQTLKGFSWRWRSRPISNLGIKLCKSNEGDVSLKWNRSALLAYEIGSKRCHCALLALRHWKLCNVSGLQPTRLFRPLLVFVFLSVFAGVQITQLKISSDSCLLSHTRWPYDTNAPSYGSDKKQKLLLSSLFLVGGTRK